jgi:hypothetical protein
MGVGMDELLRTGDQSIEAAVAAKRGTEESYASGPAGLDLMRHDTRSDDKGTGKPTSSHGLVYTTKARGS